VDRLEQSNRDTLALLDAKSTSHDKITEELTNQHQKSVSLRRELSALEERKQSIENSLNGAKFRESSLQQEIELLKRNNEWFESELKTKSSEYSKYRKEKSARITELQRVNEDANATIDSLKRTEITLRKRVDELGDKVEEGFVRIQGLQEEAVRSEESFRAELDSSRRLADLQKQSADTARRRVQELDQLLEQTKEDATEEISQVQSELESERQGHEAAETRVEQLETELERLVSQAAEQQQNTVSVTPRRQVYGLDASNTPLRPGSPAISTTPGSSRNRGGLSMTQMYSDYNNVKSELDTERRRNEKLTTTIDEMIRDLEKKEPELQELQMEHTRLEAEVTQLSSLLAKAVSERDATRKESRKFEGQAVGLQREADLLRQQLRDHSVQIKVLLVELQSHQEGSNLSAAERAQLEQAARADLSESALQGLSDTGRFISQRLATFKNVFELQDRNAQLLHLTRQLGERMEGDEAKAKQDQQDQDQVELDNLRQRVERYKDEVKSLITQSQSYIRERDMFRRMLAHRGQFPAGDLEAHFGSSTNGPATPRTPHRSGGGNNGDDSEVAKQLADYAKLIKDLQSHFDAYRQESATDLATYKAQAVQLIKEKSELQGEIARAGSQVTLAQERYEMLQANYQLLKTENGEHQKRSQTYAEIAAKQDIRTQQVAEELVDTRAQTESMRNDIANLKAERELWKKIETRLREDNQSLAEEKAKLSKIVTDTQNIANERELADSETRRKLQAQVESLESEGRIVKRKLDEEVEENKKNSLRREYEQDQSRIRIDDLVKSLGNVKEELASARTLKEQHEARIEELKIELRNAEEREQVFHPRATPRSDPVDGTDNDANAEGDAITREQELGIEVADLKKALQLAQGNIEAARAQVEQYKAFSQSSEEELQSLNESHDQYREDIDRIIAEKDSKIQELGLRVEDIMAELTTTNNQLSELRVTAEDTTTRLSQQQDVFEAELSKIKDESEKYMEMSKFHQEDLKAQAEIAQQAQQNYENELLKHAEAAKALQKVRLDYNQTKLELSESKADAEAARTTLSQSEESWQSTKDRYEVELTEMRTRHHEIHAQNKILHQQLENVGSQITRLQQSRASANAENETQGVQDTSLQNLQEVIKYLRREKEIIDVQYELSIQEAKRLRQQLDYSQTQLDETRLRLDQERQRQTDQEQNSISHSKLMDTINELNVFRESSVTLRNEARQARKQLGEKTVQVEELITQIQPLQAAVREMENEREISQGEIKLLQEDRDRWQQRTQNILQKYDRVDPAELEGLKGQVTSLQKEKDEAAVQRQSLQERVDQFPVELQKTVEEKDKQYEERRTKLVEQFKGRSRELSAKINAAAAESKGLREELATVKGELETTKNELGTVSGELTTTISEFETTKSVLENAVKKLQAVEARPAGSEDVVTTTNGQDQNSVEEGQIQENEDNTGIKNELAEAQNRAAIAEEKAQRESARAEHLQQEVEALNGRITALQAQVSGLAADLETKTSELSSLRLQGLSANTHDSSDLMEKLKQELVAAQSELEALKANRNASEGTAEATSTEITTGTSDETKIAEQVAIIKKELEDAHQEKIRSEEERFNARAQNMKTQLSARLAEGRTKFREEAVKEREEVMQTLRAEHEIAMQLLTAKHETALSDLRSQHTEELQTVKKEAPPSATTEQTGDVKAKDTSQGTLESTVTTKPVATDSLTQKEVQIILSTNEFAREILLRNIKNRLEQQAIKLNEDHEQALNQKIAEARTKQEEILREEHEKDLSQKVEELSTDYENAIQARLEEATAGFQRSKEQAVMLEGKKWSVKISMLEGRNRTAMAKLEVFHKAAEDTPQRPVAEVWAIAKDLKAAPAPPAQPPAVHPPNAALSSSNISTSDAFAPHNSGQPLQTPVETAIQQPDVNSQRPAQTPVKPVASSVPNSTAPAQSAPTKPDSTPKEVPSVPAISSQVSSVGPMLPQGEAVPTQSTQSNGTGSSAVPNGVTSIQASQQQQLPGTGLAALRGMLNQGSGIPRGGGIPRPGRGGNGPQAQQGGLSIRGGAASGHRGGDGGRGRGRGGHHQSPGGTTGDGGRNMNAGARQFVPGGNKRAREGSDGGPEGLHGKRPRGGGGDGY